MENKIFYYSNLKRGIDKLLTPLLLYIIFFSDSVLSFFLCVCCFFVNILTMGSRFNKNKIDRDLHTQKKSPEMLIRINLYTIGTITISFLIASSIYCYFHPLPYLLVGFLVLATDVLLQ